MHRELLLQDLLGPIVTELGVTTNRSMLSVGERTLSPLEWKAFVHTLLHLCAYNLSPTRYFKRPDMYPAGQNKAPSHDEFSRIWRHVNAYEDADAKVCQCRVGVMGCGCPNNGAVARDKVPTAELALFREREI